MEMYWEGPKYEDRTVILIDDGLASGLTMEAAVNVVRKHNPEAVVVAVPTSSMSAFRRISHVVDKVVCPDVSRLPIFAVIRGGAIAAVQFPNKLSTAE